MANVWSRLRKLVIDVKIWIGRSQSWIALINAGAILFLFLGRLKDSGVITLDLDRLVILVYGGIMLLMVIWGILDEKLGFYKVEAERSWGSNRNPHIDRIHESLARIEQRLDELDKRTKNG